MTDTPTIEVRPFATVHPNGYNLSMCDFSGSTYYAYRWHPKPDSWRTEIAIVKDGKTLPMIPPEKYARHSIEDPRFFVFKGELHLSCTMARSRVSGQSVDPCICGFGRPVFTGAGWYLANWTEPKHNDNVWTKQTKNLVFREDRDGNLTMTWATYPAHVVHLLDEQGNLLTGWRTESPKCSFGSYRGGSQSFPFEGKRLRFCHAVQNNPATPLYWHYHLSAYVFEPEPPFRIVKVSQQPIMSGNEAYSPGIPHHKPNVLIPYGAVKNGDGWTVSCGRNDVSCITIDLQASDLNL